MSGYTQLTQEERYQIYILKRDNCNQTQIAELLGRDKSTISRELNRNQGLRGYRPKQAHNLALARRYAASSEKISPDQYRLFDEAEADTGAEPEAEEITVPGQIRVQIYIVFGSNFGANAHHTPLWRPCSRCMT